MTKIILLILSFIPLGIHSDYLFQAWSSSRLDKLDWIFYLLAIPSVILSVRKEKTGKCDWYALFLLIPMLFLSCSGSLHHINALSVATGAVVIFSTAWLLYSWRFASRVLPAAVVLLLGTPSSSYQLSLLFMCPVLAAWGIKFLLALSCFAWIWVTKRFDLQLKKDTLFFSAAILGSCFLLLHTREIYFEGEKFVPHFPRHLGEFWGRSIQPDANTKRFFVTSTVRQYRYTKNNADISVLAVQCGRDIHEIHPASHCLRTSQWTVISEEILYLKNNFAVTEIDAEKGANRFLVWVWYSSDKFSTPGFLGFRRHFTAGGNYYTYQVSIPVYGNIEESRNELLNFIELLKKEMRK